MWINKRRDDSLFWMKRELVVLLLVFVSVFQSKIDLQRQLVLYGDCTDHGDRCNNSFKFLRRTLAYCPGTVKGRSSIKYMTGVSRIFVYRISVICKVCRYLLKIGQ